MCAPPMKVFKISGQEFFQMEAGKTGWGWYKRFLTAGALSTLGVSSLQLRRDYEFQIYNVLRLIKEQHRRIILSSEI